MIHLAEVRHSERIKLSVPALHAAVNDFLDLKMPVIVSFDRQISDFGDHNIYLDKHYIRIGLRLSEHLDLTCQKHEYINTLLHEIFHAWQYEQYGSKKYKSYAMQGVPGVDHPRISYEYCPLELEARSFADHNHLEAVLRYERFTSKVHSTHPVRSNAR